VETTINDPGDFGVGRRLTGDNWRALQAIGEQTNARFLAALGEGAPTPPDQTTLTEVVLPSATDDGLQAPGLRFGDPRVMALFAVLASFAHLVGGLTNAGLCQLMGAVRPRLHRPQGHLRPAPAAPQGLHPWPMLGSSRDDLGASQPT
jgi:hypothetical protein